MAQFSTYYYEEGNAARRLEHAALPTREDYEREKREQERLEKRRRLRAHRTACFGTGRARLRSSRYSPAAHMEPSTRPRR